MVICIFYKWHCDATAIQHADLCDKMRTLLAAHSEKCSTTISYYLFCPTPLQRRTTAVGHQPRCSSTYQSSKEEMVVLCHHSHWHQLPERERREVHSMERQKKDNMLILDVHHDVFRRSSEGELFSPLGIHSMPILAWVKFHKWPKWKPLMSPHSLASSNAQPAATLEWQTCCFAVIGIPGSNLVSSSFVWLNKFSESSHILTGNMWNNERCQQQNS